jgi:hypothetical protein
LKVGDLGVLDPDKINLDLGDLSGDNEDYLWFNLLALGDLGDFFPFIILEFCKFCCEF